MAQAWASLRAFAGGALLGVPLAAAFLDRVASVARVEGCSMQPALNPGGGARDVVLLVRWGRGRAQRGEVVSLESPRDPRQRLIKRLLALEGDEVRPPGRAPLTVPRGHAWVEGDHRGRSLDSTSFGPVPLALLHARATHILWPPRRWQRLRSQVPPGVEGGYDGQACSAAPGRLGRRDPPAGQASGR